MYGGKGKENLSVYFLSSSSFIFSILFSTLIGLLAEKTKADLPVDFFNPSVSHCYWKSLRRCGILWLWSLWLAAAVKRNKVFDKCFSDVPLCYCQIRFESINALSNFETKQRIELLLPFSLFFFSFSSFLLLFTEILDFRDKRSGEKWEESER